MYEKLAFSTNISLYFKNGKGHGHRYNGRRIASRHAIYRVGHFQWSWPTTQISTSHQYFTLNI